MIRISYFRILARLLSKYRTSWSLLLLASEWRFRLPKTHKYELCWIYTCIHSRIQVVRLFSLCCRCLCRRLGLQTEDVIEVLNRLSKAPVHHLTVSFICRRKMSYVKVRLVKNIIDISREWPSGYITLVFWRPRQRAGINPGSRARQGPSHISFSTFGWFIHGNRASLPSTPLIHVPYTCHNMIEAGRPSHHSKRRWRDDVRVAHCCSSELMMATRMLSDAKMYADTDAVEGTVSHQMWQSQRQTKFDLLRVVFHILQNVRIPRMNYHWELLGWISPAGWVYRLEVQTPIEIFHRKLFAAVYNQLGPWTQSA